jgi:3',5'-cyclic AMP phosphodiesterase CpdA
MTVAARELVTRRCGRQRARPRRSAGDGQVEDVAAMLIAQLSDPHLAPAGVRLFGRLDSAAYLERAVAHLNALAPDVVLITGDLTNDGDVPVYAAFAAMLESLRAPFFVLTGNHDDRELTRAQFSSHLPHDGPLCYAIDRFAVRLIALDTLVEGGPWGRLGPEQLVWLDARLREAPDRPTLVALHHPPFRTGIGHLDHSMLRDADALAAVIGRHPQVERVLCGHVHRSIQRRFAGTLAQSAPSCAHQTKLILGAAPATWICEPPAVLLHWWDPAAGLVSHVSMIGDYGPPGRFSDPHMPVAGSRRLPERGARS